MPARMAGSKALTHIFIFFCTFGAVLGKQAILATPMFLLTLLLQIHCQMWYTAASAEHSDIQPLPIYTDCYSSWSSSVLWSAGHPSSSCSPARQPQHVSIALP
jgi:hypothetical protein